jgi:hypothetical protein
VGAIVAEEEVVIAWGTVPRSNLIRPVLVTYWPPSRWTWR